LEVYDLTQSSDYPNAPMTGIDLQINGRPARLHWSPDAMTNPAFGEHTNIVSNGTPGGEVELVY
jgi:hypothetical protein